MNLTIATCTCGKPQTSATAKYVGSQNLGGVKLLLFNCHDCKSTFSVEPATLAQFASDASRKLEGLREEFDRCDANHPHQAVQVARDISECASGLEALLKFKKEVE